MYSLYKYVILCFHETFAESHVTLMKNIEFNNFLMATPFVFYINTVINLDTPLYWKKRF